MSDWSPSSPERPILPPEGEAGLPAFGQIGFGQPGFGEQPFAGADVLFRGAGLAGLVVYQQAVAGAWQVRLQVPGATPGDLARDVLVGVKASPFTKAGLREDGGMLASLRSALAEGPRAGAATGAGAGTRAGAAVGAAGQGRLVFALMEHGPDAAWPELESAIPGGPAVVTAARDGSVVEAAPGAHVEAGPNGVGRLATAMAGAGTIGDRLASLQPGVPAEAFRAEIPVLAPGAKAGAGGQGVRAYGLVAAAQASREPVSQGLGEGHGGGVDHQMGGAGHALGERGATTPGLAGGSVAAELGMAEAAGMGRNAAVPGRMPTLSFADADGTVDHGTLDGRGNPASGGTISGMGLSDRLAGRGEADRLMMATMVGRPATAHAPVRSLGERVPSGLPVLGHAVLGHAGGGRLGAGLGQGPAVRPAEGPIAGELGGSGTGAGTGLAETMLVPKPLTALSGPRAGLAESGAADGRVDEREAAEPAGAELDGAGLNGIGLAIDGAGLAKTDSRGPGVDALAQGGSARAGLVAEMADVLSSDTAARTLADAAAGLHAPPDLAISGGSVPLRNLEQGGAAAHGDRGATPPEKTSPETTAPGAPVPWRPALGQARSSETDAAGQEAPAGIMKPDDATLPRPGTHRDTTVEHSGRGLMRPADLTSGDVDGPDSQVARDMPPAMGRQSGEALHPDGGGVGPALHYAGPTDAPTERPGPQESSMDGRPPLDPGQPAKAVNGPGAEPGNGLERRGEMGETGGAAAAMAALVAWQPPPNRERTPRQGEGPVPDGQAFHGADAPMVATGWAGPDRRAGEASGSKAAGPAAENGARVFTTPPLQPGEQPGLPRPDWQRPDQDRRGKRPDVPGVDVAAGQPDADRGHDGPRADGTVAPTGMPPRTVLDSGSPAAKALINQARAGHTTAFAPDRWPTERAAARVAAMVLAELDRLAAAEGVMLAAWIGVLTDAGTARFSLGAMAAGVPSGLPAGACTVVRWRAVVRDAHQDMRRAGAWPLPQNEAAGSTDNGSPGEGPGGVAGPAIEEAAALRHWAVGSAPVRSYGVETCFTATGPAPVLTCLACQGPTLRLSYVALPGQPARCPVPLALHAQDMWGRPFNALRPDAIDTTDDTVS